MNKTIDYGDGITAVLDPDIPEYRFYCEGFAADHAGMPVVKPYRGQYRCVANCGMAYSDGNSEPATLPEAMRRASEVVLRYQAEANTLAAQRQEMLAYNG